MATKPLEKELRSLIVHIWEARNLRPSSVTARVLLGDQYGCTIEQRETNNPIWMEEIEFDIMQNVVPKLYLQVLSVLPATELDSQDEEDVVEDAIDGPVEDPNALSLSKPPREKLYTLELEIKDYLPDLAKKRWMSLSPSGEICISITPLYYPYLRSRLQRVGVTLVGGNIMESETRDAQLEPYVVVQLEDTSFKSERRPGTLFPVWNEMFTFEVTPRTMLRLDLTLKDWDWVYDKDLGYASLDLSALALGTELVETKVPIFNHGRHMVGDLLLHIEGFFIAASLTVTIREAAGLGIASSPSPLYVQAVWGGSQERRSSPVPSSSDPEWNETLTFELSQPSELYLGIFQRNGNLDDLLGEGVVPLGQVDLLEKDVSKWVKLVKKGRDGNGMLHIIVNQTTQVPPVTYSPISSPMMSAQGPYSYPESVPPIQSDRQVWEETVSTNVSADSSSDESESVATSFKSLNSRLAGKPFVEVRLLGAEDLPCEKKQPTSYRAGLALGDNPPVWSSVAKARGNPQWDQRFKLPIDRSLLLYTTIQILKPDGTSKHIGDQTINLRDVVMQPDTPHVQSAELTHSGAFKGRLQMHLKATIPPGSKIPFVPTPRSSSYSSFSAAPSLPLADSPSERFPDQTSNRTLDQSSVRSSLHPSDYASQLPSRRSSEPASRHPLRRPSAVNPPNTTRGSVVFLDSNRKRPSALSIPPSQRASVVSDRQPEELSPRNASRQGAPMYGVALTVWEANLQTIPRCSSIVVTVDGQGDKVLPLTGRREPLCNDELIFSCPPEGPETLCFTLMQNDYTAVATGTVDLLESGPQFHRKQVALQPSSAGDLICSMKPLPFAFPRDQLQNLAITVVQGQVLWLKDPIEKPYIQLRLGEALVETPPSPYWEFPVWQWTSNIPVAPDAPLVLNLQMRPDHSTAAAPFAEGDWDLGALDLQQSSIRETVELRRQGLLAATLTMTVKAQFYALDWPMLRCIKVTVLNALALPPCRGQISVEATLGKVEPKKTRSVAAGPKITWNQQLSWQAQDSLDLKLQVINELEQWDKVVCEGQLDIGQLALNAKNTIVQWVDLYKDDRYAGTLGLEVEGDFASRGPSATWPKQQPPAGAKTGDPHRIPVRSQSQTGRTSPRKRIIGQPAISDTPRDSIYTVTSGWSSQQQPSDDDEDEPPVIVGQTTILRPQNRLQTPVPGARHSVATISTVHGVPPPVNSYKRFQPARNMHPIFGTRSPNQANPRSRSQPREPPQPRGRSQSREPPQFRGQPQSRERPQSRGRSQPRGRSQSPGGHAFDEKCFHCQRRAERLRREAKAKGLHNCAPSSLVPAWRAGLC